ncbi:MAG TPA: hypothetical protein PLG34_09790, partial [Spirochaetota bacterium]|nr:hypothetical protein [Spirochaetota bacterium]HPY88262.1 hypothetical protein [Spirochaetota bacterium]
IITALADLINTFTLASYGVKIKLTHMEWSKLFYSPKNRRGRLIWKNIIDFFKIKDYKQP